MAKKMTKKDIISEIEKTFREHPDMEVVVKDYGFRNTRWGMHGYALCWFCNTIMVRPWSTSTCFWKANLMALKKPQLAEIMEKAWKSI